MKLDEKDRAIITELIANSRQTIGKLSKKLGIPVTTVHNRIKKLENGGIINNYTVNLNYKKLGRPLLAYIAISVTYHIGGKTLTQSGVAEAIKKIPGVEDVAILAGGSDILAKVLAKDVDDLNAIVTEKLRAIEGVDKTQTMIVLKEM